MTSINKENRFWGWGYTDHEYDKEKSARFLDALVNLFDMKELPPKATHSPIESFDIPKSNLPENFINSWKEKGLSIDNSERLFHAFGKSYRDLVRIRAGTAARVPDGVLFLKNTHDLTDLFQEAKENNLLLIPFGGGTGVVGGTECVGSEQKPILVVDMTHLRRVISIDQTSRIARIEAGILGPKLEEALNKKDFTLGHFPQSFEFSSLGGWVATRSAGQNSTKYGKIEDMVQSLVVHTPKGAIETSQAPASATGPSLKQLLIGSEGIYGIITEASVKISPLPESQKFVSAFFKNFEQGINCIRNIMQSDLSPSIIRLSDPDESSLFLSLMLSSAFQKKAVPYWFKWKNLGEKPCFFLLATEGRKTHVKFQLEKMKSVIKNNQGAVIKKSFDHKWKKDRFELPYLRDSLMDHGFFIDTLETAAPWSKLMGIYESMKFAFLQQKENNLHIACHLSHAYKDGASLYFTFIGQQKKGAEIKQWEDIKTMATNVIMDHGGTLSHHHGIGYDHKKWMSLEKSPLGIDALKAVKNELDVDGILNPGKVF